VASLPAQRHLSLPESGVFFSSPCSSETLISADILHTT
jgi:hypothetical protein